MLRFTSFFPMASLLKIELAFDDEKITEKYKSLTGEGEDEIPYSKIAIIQFVRWADMRWATVGVCIAILTVFLLGVLCYLFPDLGGNPVMLTGAKITFLAGAALFIPAFIKRDLCYFYDKDQKYLTCILITSKNLDDVYDAVEFVKTKTTLLSETYPALLGDEKEPKLKLVVDFFPNYLNKNTILFYEDKILDMEKSLLREATCEYKYADLTKRVSILKYGDSDWDSVFTFLMWIGVIIWLGWSLFFPDVEKGIQYLLIAAGILLIPVLMRYIKNEFVVFYDKNDNVAFTIKIPRGKKQKVEEIIQFVKMKVAEISET